MGKFFVHLYNFFERHKVLFYISLITSVLVLAYASSQLKFEENITRFFPDTENDKNLNEVFNNLRIKDKIVVMFSSPDSLADESDLIESATLFGDSLNAEIGETHIKSIVLRIDDNLKNEVQNFVYDNLPIFLNDSDYTRLDSLFIQEKMNAVMQKNYSNLLSPAGVVLKDYIMRDPLGIAGNTLKRLQDFQLDTNFEQIDGHVFTKDGKTLLMFVTPTHSMGSTGENDKLITAIESKIASVQAVNPSVSIEYYGGPSVGVYNARQIKNDSILTLNIALVIIIAFVFFAFKEKRTIPLIITPVLFGGLFSLAMIYLLKGSISAIAVGSGSVVLGVALSYSIHMIVHQGHVASVQQLIEELTYPLTVGSFTTIGAFLGLLFTSSDLLRDFGLFASMALIGTTIFCLVFLPHFLKGEVNQKKGKLLLFIEKINSYRFDKNKWLVGAIVLITIICIFTSRWVSFDTDMMSMNYEPEHIRKAEQKLLDITEGDKKTVMFVSVGKDISEATQNYKKTNKKLAELKNEGLIKNFASADYFLIPQKEQEERLARWNSYWNTEKIESLKSSLQKEGAKFKFRPDAFDQFYTWVDQDFTEQNKQYKEQHLGSNNFLGEWQNTTPEITMLISQVQLDDKHKDAVYQQFSDASQVVVFDRAHFTSKWVTAVNDDFYLILTISSFLIFFTLLISYGRIELTLISYLPMLISWLIIIGIMGIIGMKFNIINIIISTFIFGIGDDYSIFIMDGLQNKYRTKKRVLNGHKTAIFFSAFTVVVGMGSLIFAQHPALQSISVMSILGMLVVVLVSYTIPPIIFRFLISAPAAKGFPPHTLSSLILTGIFYGLFVVGCISLRITTLLLYIIPISKKGKRRLVCYLIMHTCRCICSIKLIFKVKKIDISKKIFDKPSIIIANHQSFTDILFLLSLSSKVVMVTNHWVWRSPFFGSVIRYAGYLFAGDGYENSTDLAKQRLDEGYSIIIFPEGTRSEDRNLKRFHKGAFFYAQKLNADIIPIVLYGTGMIVSKAQPFYIKSGIVVLKALPKISNADISYGISYKERAKRIANYFRDEYESICKEYDNVEKNPYFYRMLVKNYIYKGPVEEWYVRIKVKMEKSYLLFDKLIPQSGQITDIGCGYGMLPYMLMMLSADRKVLGIDYDEDKIKVAQHGFLNNERISFACADAISYDIPASNTFILNDILHYMNWQDQQTLLKKCASQLLPGGTIIVRDGNRAEQKKQWLTNLTEIFSTRILGFNKTKEELCFVSAEQMQSIASECGMSIESFKNDKYTSNTIFLFKKNKNE